MSDLTFDEMREKLNKALSFGIYTTEAKQYVTGLFEAVIARAEAAEARVAELEFTQRGLLDRLEVQRVYALDAEIEVQRLRAELDAQQWRPATEAPGKGRWYQVFDANEDWYDHRFYKGPGWGVLGDDQPPLYWRPIPLMPQESQ